MIDRRYDRGPPVTLAGQGVPVTGSRNGWTRLGLVVLTAWLASAFGASETERTPRVHSLQNATEAQAREFGDTFRWRAEGPLDFLALLKSRAKSGARYYTVYGTHVGWLQESDLPGLISLVDSREPCSHVVMAMSSYAPTTRSFVGQEALFLIEGYRQGRYPPTLGSRGFYKAKKQEILEWWQRLHPGPRPQC